MLSLSLQEMEAKRLVLSDAIQELQKRAANLE